jgi:hypothetical protein
MPTPGANRRYMAGYAAVYGPCAPTPPVHRPRSPHAALRELQAGTRSLADQVDGWTLPPTAADLAGVRATLAGLARVAAELAGGPSDG